MASATERTSAETNGGATTATISVENPATGERLVFLRTAADGVGTINRAPLTAVVRRAIERASPVVAASAGKPPPGALPATPTKRRARARVPARAPAW